ncbi:hypothetical protein GW17_00048532 [Ensete ventricosum]|uniref:Uncharacterized protein n=1 Tax=Ensete ventricosum TaxID=4639 RepID=A0A426YLK3_ENSVE|nr:hypothetical protein B296_00024421 [Ensete ventricosum]RWV89320.1 hypothetical protein GW17_00048532 [Ensete ventricosum]RZS03792.1 hypothetical protein BHM03_00034015 [Ensete ventricosum]
MRSVTMKSATSKADGYRRGSVGGKECRLGATSSGENLQGAQAGRLDAAIGDKEQWGRVPWQNLGDYSYMKHPETGCYSPFYLQPTISGEIQSPMGVATVEFIDPREPVMVCMHRDETTLEPSVYLNK